jgi:hypothetical protein
MAGILITIEGTVEYVMRHIFFRVATVFKPGDSRGGPAFP